MSEVGNSITVRITDLSRAGSGVARLESGEVVFIPLTIPGDTVVAQIIERKKNYLHAELKEITTASPHRREPPCKVFGKCGGCSWQHIPYSLQFETKQKGVLHALKRADIVVEAPVDSLPADEEFHYRNRVQLRGDPQAHQLGFYERGSKKLVPIDHCWIADTRLNEALAQIKTQAATKFNREYKVELGLDPQGHLQTAWNQGHAALGFRQVNDAQNLKLQNWVKQHLRPASALFDLYGGAGNLSLPLLHAFESIDCVDIQVPRESPAPHFRFHRGQVGRWVSNQSKLPASASLILDPPREGLDQDTQAIIEFIKKMTVASVILVSCDVDAFVRDTRKLLKAGFHLSRIGVLDLFPQTPHVESLALFTPSTLN